MLFNLLSLLEKNADAIWLCAGLLALAFGRNRYLLVLSILSVPLYGSAYTAGTGLLASTLVLLVCVLPEPPLRSLRVLALGLAIAALTQLPHLPAQWLQQLSVLSRWPDLVRFDVLSLLMVSAATWALLRWLRFGWPLDLHLSLVLLPAIVAMSPAPPVSMRAWLMVCAAAMIIAILYGAYRMAFMDALTGLPNRRSLDERLARSGGRMAVAMVDIDFFKRFNDRHGHESGDRVLKAVARQLRRCKGGTAYRYGGEEFAIVFDGRQVEHAGEALEQIRASVEALRVSLRKSSTQTKAQAVRRGQSTGDVGVTISIGLAQRDPERRTCDAVVDAADKALYRSKQRGRNRLTLAGAARMS